MGGGEVGVGNRSMYRCRSVTGEVAVMISCVQH